MGREKDSTEDLADRLREAAPDLEAARRARMRQDVLRNLPRGPQGPRFEDRVYDLLELLAVPTPYLLRAFALLIIGASLLGMATLASADAVPDEPLYGLKVAAEQVRLALAQRPEDRASVELSIAEHRLAEAERLASAGRANAAIVASSAFGSHIANAAAELAEVEALTPQGAPMAKQLEVRLVQQQAKAAVTAQKLANDPRTVQAAAVLATVAAPQDAGTGSVAARVAETAAQVAEQLASVAAERAQLPTPTPRAAPTDEPVAAEEDEEDVAPAAPTAVNATKQEPQRAEPQRTARTTPTPPTTTTARSGATPRPTIPASRATASPRTTTSDARAAQAAATRTPRPTTRPVATQSARPTLPPNLRPTGTPNASARAAAEAAKKSAEQARIAADKAKQAAKKTPAAKPTARPTLRPTPKR